MTKHKNDNIAQLFYLWKAFFAHSVCANFGLNTHSVCANFSLIARSPVYSVHLVKIRNMAGEAGQQQQVEAPMIVLEELENVAMTLMNGESGTPIGGVVAAKQPKTYSCEKCRMKFNTFQTLQDHNFSFKMMHSRVSSRVSSLGQRSLGSAHKSPFPKLL